MGELGEGRKGLRGGGKRDAVVSGAPGKVGLFFFKIVKFGSRKDSRKMDVQYTGKMGEFLVKCFRLF